MEEETKKKKSRRRRRQITCRAPIKGQLEAIDLPHMNLQISPAMEGDGIILTVWWPRNMIRRPSFRVNIYVLVGFFIFVAIVIFPTIQKEAFYQEELKLRMLGRFLGSMFYYLGVELSHSIPRETQEQQRRARLVAWFQEALYLIVLLTVDYWIL